MQYYNLKIYM